jgi:transcription antitermination factor NusG
MAVIHSALVSDTAPLHWYALHTRSRHEKAIAARLDLQATETFLPVHRSRHTWRNGVHAEVDLPLFPGYLFARMRIGEKLRLLQTPGVLGFAATSARPIAITDEEMELLRCATGSLKAEPHPYLSCGDKVRIAAGPLAGLEGILTRRKNEYRVVLSIDAIMRAVVVEVSEFDIESIEKRADDSRQRCKT